MAANPPRYEAFISYRHVPADEAAAKRVQHALEGFRIPRALRRDERRSLGRLFRDEDELKTSSPQARRSRRRSLAPCATPASSS